MRKRQECEFKGATLCSLAPCPTATYLGIDISSIMIGHAKRPIASYVDRVVCVYLFDILLEEDIRQAVAEAHRVLKPDGKLCVASLAEGVTVVSRIVSTLWAQAFRLNSWLVGGCRPLRLNQFLSPLARRRIGAT